MTQNKMVWLGIGKYQERKTCKKQKKRLKTPWSSELPEKLTAPDIVKKFPAFYGIQRFNKAFTRTHHLSLP
jgi:hypothetical protein